MKAVILAAGEGKRMEGLTKKTPKPLLKVAGKTLLEHVIDVLPEEVRELVVVIGYLGEKIQNFLGREFKGRQIHYVWQPKQLGTGHALWLCQELLKESKFLLLFTDDIHTKEDIKRLMKHDLAILVKEVDNPCHFGVVAVDKSGRVMDIEEKPKKPKSNLVDTGAKALDGRIFNYYPELSDRGEYYLTDMLKQLMREHTVLAEYASTWIPISYPQDLARAEKILKAKARQN